MDFSIDSLLLILCQISIIQSAIVPLTVSNPESLPNPESAFITLLLKNNKPEKISITKPSKGIDKLGIENTRKGIQGSEIVRIDKNPDKAPIIEASHNTIKPFDPQNCRLPIIIDIKTQVHNLMEEVPYQIKSKFASIESKNDISATKTNNACITIPQEEYMVEEIQECNNLLTQNSMPTVPKNTLEHEIQKFDSQLFSSESRLAETEKYIRQIELENNLRNQEYNKIHDLLAVEKFNADKYLNQCGNNKLVLENSELMQQLSNRAITGYDVNLPSNPLPTTVSSIDSYTQSNLLEPLAMTESMIHSPKPVELPSKEFFTNMNTFLDFDKSNILSRNQIVTSNDLINENDVLNNVQFKPRLSTIENMDVNKIVATPMIDYGVLGDTIRANEMMTTAESPFLIKKSGTLLNNDYASIIPFNKYVDYIPFEPTISPYIENLLTNNNIKKLHNHIGTSKIDKYTSTVSPVMLKESKKQEPVMLNKTFPNWEATEKFVNDAYKTNTEIINSIINQSKIKQFNKASLNSDKDICVKSFPDIPFITNTKTKGTALPIDSIPKTLNTTNKLEGCFPSNTNKNQIIVPKHYDLAANQFDNHTPVTNMVCKQNKSFQEKVEDTVVNILQPQVHNSLPNNQCKLISPALLAQQSTEVQAHPEANILSRSTNTFNMASYTVPTTKIETSYPVTLSDSLSVPILNKGDSIVVTPLPTKCSNSKASVDFIEPLAMYNSLSTTPCSSILLPETKPQCRELYSSSPLINSVSTYQSSDCFKSKEFENIIEPVTISTSILRGTWSSLSPSETKVQQNGLDYSLPVANNVPLTGSSSIEPITTPSNYVFMSTNDHYVDHFSNSLGKLVPALTSNIVSALLANSLNKQSNDICSPLKISENHRTCYPPILKKSKDNLTPHIISPTYLTSTDYLETGSTNIGTKKSMDLINLPPIKSCDPVPYIYPENPAFYYSPSKSVDSATPPISAVMPLNLDSELSVLVNNPKKCLNSPVAPLIIPCITLPEDYAKNPPLSNILSTSNNFVTPLSTISSNTAYSDESIFSNTPLFLPRSFTYKCDSSLPCTDVESNIKFNTEENITESLVPYIASITINVMPPKDNQNHVIIVI